MGRFLVVLLLFFLGPPLYARDLLQEIQDIQKQKSDLFQEHKRLLLELSTLERTLFDLSWQYEQKKKDIALQQKEVSEKLPLLARLGRMNPLRILVDVSTGQSTLRGIILLKTLIMSLKRQIQSIQAELLEIEGLSQEFDLKSQAYQTLIASIEAQQAELSVLEGQKVEEYTQSEIDRLSQVEDINALLDESYAALSKAKRKASAKTTGAGLPFRWLERPVNGQIVEDKSLQKKYGPHGKGIIFSTHKNAEVMAPTQGKVVFKGPFQNQGDILILDHGEKIYTVLMGMHKIDAQMGQSVYAGEKLGTMAGYGATLPKLYLELRQGGKAIDPRPYLID